jgi:hypothetical protein
MSMSWLHAAAELQLALLCHLLQDKIDRAGGEPLRKAKDKVASLRVRHGSLKQLIENRLYARCEALSCFMHCPALCMLLVRSHAMSSTPLLDTLLVAQLRTPPSKQAPYHTHHLFESAALQAKQAELSASATKKAVQLKASSKQLEKLKKDIAKLGECESAG